MTILIVIMGVVILLLLGMNRANMKFIKILMEDSEIIRGTLMKISQMKPDIFKDKKEDGWRIANEMAQHARETIITTSTKKGEK